MPHENDYALEHSSVLNEADLIFIKMSEIRGQMWLDYPPSDKLRELRERIDRLDHAYKFYEESGNLGAREALIEDAIDMINFSAFFVKQIRRDMHG